MSDAKSIFFGINQSPEKNNETKYHLLDQNDKITIQPSASDVKPTSVYQNIPCNSFIAQKQLNGASYNENQTEATNDNVDEFIPNDNNDDQESAASTKSGNDLDTFDLEPTSEDKPTQVTFLSCFQSFLCC